MPELVHGEAEAEVQVLRGLRLAVELSIVVLVVEAVGAYFSHSLALTADAVHNVPDIVAFAVSWGALRATEQGVTASSTYGPHRAEVFAGPVNATWLLAAALPTLGLRVVNLVALGRIPGRVRDLNLRSVLVHLASDVVITAALLIAGAVLFLSPALNGADDVSAVVIGAVLVYECLPLFRDSWEVLGEQTPRGISVPAVVQTALAVPGVAEVHDVHVWALCPTLVCMTAHVGVRDMSVQEWGSLATTLRRRMETEHGILHAVFEVEATPG